MYKPVRLQGWGAPSTIINAAKFSAAELRPGDPCGRKIDAQQVATCPAPDPTPGPAR